MARIKKTKRKGVTGISTASLPDIVFMLLFFFMAAAVMKTSDPLIEYQLPNSDKLYRFEDPSLLVNIRIGKNENQLTWIQLGDALHPAHEIERYVNSIVGSTPEHLKSKVNAYLEVDKSTKMGTVNKVKEHIRDAELYQVVLAGNEK